MQPLAADANEPIPVFEGSVTVTLADAKTALDATARVSLQWAPTPHVEIHAEVPDAGIDPNWLIAPAVRSVMCWPADGKEVDLVLTGWNTHPPRLRGVPGGALRYSTGSSSMSRVDFHLVNFPAFHHRPKPTESGAKVRQEALLKSETWSIRLKAHEQTFRLVDKLRQRGGYAATHHGTVERADGGAISESEVDSLFEALERFCAFARGFWAPPVLLNGYDASGRRVWEEWGIPKITPWTVVESWFDPDHAEQLESVFPGFMARWRSPRWQRPISSAIYWYVHSNTMSGGVDGSVILAQAALELLAWTLIVEDRRMISAAAFDRLPAPDKLRLLLSTTGIPLQIPEACKGLSKCATKSRHKDVDGPGVTVEIRNMIVHPKLEERFELAADALIETWKLQQWYIELVILRLCDYSGAYANRLRTPRPIGVVEPVPWAS